MKRAASRADDLLEQCLERYRDTPGGPLSLLHAIQDALGYIPPHAVPAIAGAMRLSRAEVHGVISFYRDFHTVAQGRHRLQICRAEACQAMGAAPRGGEDLHSVVAAAMALMEERQ